MQLILALTSAVNAASLGFASFQSNAPWGLARISHPDWDQTKSATATGYININTYFYDQVTTPVTVYILDTGVDVDHPEFGGRASWGPNFVTDQNVDDNGHGTHLAGIIGGSTVGVARQANIIAVKILDSKRTGTVDHFAKAVDYVIADSKRRQGKFIINYSAVGDINDPRADAVNRAINAGILVVNAAGNKNDLACNYGPANMGLTTKGFLVVGALNYTNSPASFTNYGKCVSIFAPGVSINSTLPNNNFGIMAGTSNAAAFISGLGAYLWAQNPDYSLADLDSLIRSANPNAVVNNFPDTTNALAYNGFF